MELMTTLRMPWTEYSGRHVPDCPGGAKAATHTAPPEVTKPVYLGQKQPRVPHVRQTETHWQCCYSAMQATAHLCQVMH